jgi:hypothetical protein
MPTTEETVNSIAAASTWDERIARFRQIPQRHGTDEHTAIYADVAKLLYVPHLAADYAYVPVLDFYELPHFQAAYDKIVAATAGFTDMTVERLTAAISAEPTILLPLRTIIGLRRQELAWTTRLVAEPLGMSPLSESKIDSMERSGSATSTAQARIVAETLDQVIRGGLFGEPPGRFKSKEDKPDTVDGWASVQAYAATGVPYSVFLHQRHYGGAFRQVMDAGSEMRGNLIEDAVEALFAEHDIKFIRTGAHSQAEITFRFEITVRPAPDFVVYDSSDNLRAMLECKAANDGGTARDKALRFERLRDESVRLGGVPLIAILGGLGWTRVNDTLGPVIRDCDGRVFSVGNLPEMLTVSPFPMLIGNSG